MQIRSLVTLATLVVSTLPRIEFTDAGMQGSGPVTTEAIT